jgi:hypothetical protein
VRWRAGRTAVAVQLLVLYGQRSNMRGSSRNVCLMPPVAHLLDCFDSGGRVQLHVQQAFFHLAQK